MSNIILLFVCLAIGMLLRKSGRAPENSHLALNTFIIYVSLPALTLLQLHGIRWQPSSFYAVAMPWILFLGAVAFFRLVARALQLTPQTSDALMLCGGLANTSFVGLPMIEAFYGPNGIPTGILIDQLGTYLVLSTLGIAIAAVYSTGQPSAREILQRICTFPPFIALLAALAMSPVEFPQWLTDVLHRLGDTLAPLALVSVGMQLRFDQLQGIKAPLRSVLVSNCSSGRSYWQASTWDCSTPQAASRELHCLSRRWARRSALPSLRSNTGSIRRSSPCWWAWA
jgi:predicted permease